jgi:hypothetical protein
MSESMGNLWIQNNRDTQPYLTMETVNSSVSSESMNVVMRAFSEPRPPSAVLELPVSQWATSGQGGQPRYTTRLHAMRGTQGAALASRRAGADRAPGAHPG